MPGTQRVLPHGPLAPGLSFLIRKRGEQRGPPQVGGGRTHATMQRRDSRTGTCHPRSASLLAQGAVGAWDVPTEWRDEQEHAGPWLRDVRMSRPWDSWRDVGWDLSWVAGTRPVSREPLEKAGRCGQGPPAACPGLTPRGSSSCLSPRAGRDPCLPPGPPSGEHGVASRKDSGCLGIWLCLLGKPERKERGPGGRGESERPWHAGRRPGA